jgi:hypothetical protein
MINTHIKIILPIAHDKGELITRDKISDEDYKRLTDYFYDYHINEKRRKKIKDMEDKGNIASLRHTFMLYMKGNFTLSTQGEGNAYNGYSKFMKLMRAIRTEVED